jgi:hypothetical protein
VGALAPAARERRPAAGAKNLGSHTTFGVSGRRRTPPVGGQRLRGIRLRNEIVPVHALRAGESRRLFELFARHYEHVTWPRFQADLAEKDCVIVLRDADTGEVRGFSTQKVIPAVVQGRRLRALFSGDTIIDPACWGDQELIRGWCRFAGAVRAADRESPLYWFLISKGYRTYLYLPLFFTRYYPNPTDPPPPFEQDVIDTLATQKFGDCYRRASGTLEFPERVGNLTPALAAVPPARQRDPRVRFFLERNPDHALGTELVCLAEISPGNMRSIAGRALAESERRAAAAAPGTARPAPALAAVV